MVCTKERCQYLCDFFYLKEGVEVSLLGLLRDNSCFFKQVGLNVPTTWLEAEVEVYIHVLALRVEDKIR